jgi:hypothetical protein
VVGTITFHLFTPSPLIFISRSSQDQVNKSSKKSCMSSTPFGGGCATDPSGRESGSGVASTAYDVDEDVERCWRAAAADDLRSLSDLAR